MAGGKTVCLIAIDVISVGREINLAYAEKQLICWSAWKMVDHKIAMLMCEDGARVSWGLARECRYAHVCAGVFSHVSCGAYELGLRSGNRWRKLRFKSSHVPSSTSILRILVVCGR
jgi:hypothetical protein